MLSAVLKLPLASRERDLKVAAAALVPAAALAVIVDRPDLYRELFAALIAAGLLVVAFTRPAVGALLTLMFLPSLALLRRLLISQTGWTSTDPLLLVGPLVAAALFVDLFAIRRRRLAPDTMSKCAAGLLLLALVEVVNPIGGGIVTNLGGLMFIGVPLLWFFIGREYATERRVNTLLHWVVASALVIAIYGLWQTYVGFPSWDSQWLSLTGYSSLYVVSGVTRAFATFSSSAEYAAYLSIATVVALALALHRRPTFALAIPVLATALFLESSRGVFLITLAVAVCVAALRTGNGRLALVLSIGALAVAAGGIAIAGHSVGQQVAQSDNPLVAHQVGGLLNPTDPSSSTLTIHLNLIGHGFLEGVRHPLGEGTGTTTIASTQLSGGATQDLGGRSSTGKGTENDVTNSFISLGVAGPILLLTLAIVAFRRSIGRYLRQRDPIWLATAGVLLATFGQWMNGQEYAVAPFAMFLLGWTARAAPA